MTLSRETICKCLYDNALFETGCYHKQVSDGYMSLVNANKAVCQVVPDSQKKRKGQGLKNEANKRITKRITKTS